MFPPLSKDSCLLRMCKLLQVRWSISVYLSWPKCFLMLKLNPWHHNLGLILVLSIISMKKLNSACDTITTLKSSPTKPLKLVASQPVLQKQQLSAFMILICIQHFSDNFFHFCILSGILILSSHVLLLPALWCFHIYTHTPYHHLDTDEAWILQKGEWPQEIKLILLDLMSFYLTKLLTIILHYFFWAWVF